MPVIRGLTRFLTMAEVAEIEDGEVIIDCVAIFYEEGKGGEHYRKKNTFTCRVSSTEKRLVKSRRGFGKLVRLAHTSDAVSIR